MDTKNITNINWVSDFKCNINGLEFELTTSGYTKKTTAESIIVLKPKFLLDDYQSRFGGIDALNILEVGIFQGGTTLFLAAALPNINKIAALDIAPPVETFLKIVQDGGFASKIFPYFSLSQTNEEAISNIVNRTLDSRLDVVIDDASHKYPETKRTFEIVFPLLANGGLYVIEDWGWAHWKDCPWQKETHHWYNDPALSNLIFELTMLCASAPAFIKKIEVFPAYVVLSAPS